MKSLKKPVAKIVRKRAGKGLAALADAAPDNDSDSGLDTFADIVAANRDDRDDDSEGAAAAPPRYLPRGDIAKALAWRCLRAALPVDLRKRIRAGHAVALVIQAPGPDWVDPLSEALARDPRPIDRIARDGSSRSGHKTALGNDIVAGALARGKSIAGVSQAPSRFLPATLVAVADAHVVVSPPDTGTLRRLLRAHARGRIPADIPDGVAVGLSFTEIVSAFRAGARARDVIANLQTTAARKTQSSPSDDCPPLQDLPGYPAAARQWGLSLASAVADFKAGRGPWPSDSAALLFGPPGTGKSLYARALAKSCGLSFVATSVGEWFRDSKGDLGDVVCAAQRSWDAALAARPAIWFIDEIDSLPNRGALDADRLSWWGPIVDTVLLMLSGSDSDRTGLAILAATNHRDRLDPALIRPGRLGRLIEIPPPDAQGLADVLRFHLGDALPGVDLATVTRLVPGATPAQAAAWADDARRIAKDSGRAPTIDDLIAAVAPPDDRDPRDLRVAAVHEAGHAIAYVDAGRGISSTSVVLRGDAGGETRATGSLPMFPTRAHLDAAIVPMLAGRAAEETILGAASSGSDSDLAKATAILVDAHTVKGLGASLVHRGDPAASLLSYDRDLRAAVEADLQRLYAKACALIRRRRAAVERIADALVAKRFLTGDEVAALAASPRVRASGPKIRRRTP